MAATGERQLSGKARKGESGSQETCLRSKATSTLEERVPLMHIHSLRRAALAACAFAALAAPSAADAFTTQLRVEADGKDLGHGSHYVHDSVTYETSTECGGTGDSYTIDGPSALGLLIQAAGLNQALRPVQISDEFDFGQFVCGVGGYEGTDTAYWLYKVDHVAPEVGGEQFPIDRSHGTVLWYFVNGTSNSGNELELIVSDKIVRAGEPVDVTVREYDATGKASPAKGVRLKGADGVRTKKDGTAEVVFNRGRFHSIRGVRGPDIPTATEELCVWEKSASECDLWRPVSVFGTNRDDRLSGTDDPDSILARDGDDRITSRGDHQADTVGCGAGEDVVRADQRDRVKRSCETVRRR
jgi:hypothetical protein